MRGCSNLLRAPGRLTPRLVAALVLFLVLLGTPRIQARPLTVTDHLAVKWLRQLTLAPDGQHAAFVLRQADYAKNSWQSNIYLVATDSSPGALRQLTTSAASDSQPAFSPDGRRLAFVSSRGGTPQIWLLPLDGGEASQLTRLASGASGPLWSPDGKLIAFSSSVFPECKSEACNRQRLEAQQKSKVKAQVFDSLLYRHWNSWRDARRSHLFVIPADGGEPRDLTPGPYEVPPLALGGGRDYAFSPDSKTLAYVTNTDPHPERSTNNDVFEVAVGGGKPRRLSSSKGNDNTPRYSPDGRTLAYLSMARAGYESDRPRILVRELKSGREQEWSAGYSGHPLELVWTPDSRALLFNAPHQGQLELFRAGPGGVTQLSQGLYAKELELSADGRFLVLLDQAADRPPEVVRLSGDGQRRQALTRLNAWLPQKIGMQPAEHVWFSGAGGDKVHAVLVKPPGFRRERRYPAMVMIHGGPQGMTGDDYHPRWNLQMFAAQGYVVFGINFHGSVGFGQAFTDSITGDWGGKPYKDVLAGVEHLAGLPYVNGRRICAAGASYGGYLVNWIATHSNRFSCLISHAGVFNLESKYGSTEELWFPEWDMQGTPWTNRPLYRKWSPHSYAEKLKTPTLVIHGQHDYRVPVEQGFQLFTALQRQGVSSRLLYFPDEDHFVQKPQNIELWWQTMWSWLGRYLK